MGIALSSAEMLSVVLLVILAALVGIMGWRAWKKSRISPEEMERRRRKRLTALGKMGDATLIEVRGDFIFYSYDVRGVVYTASQNVAALKPLLPTDEAVVAAPVLVKYDARNPADSIIIAEDWNGLQILPRPS
ncbi:MAG: hypothetical protein ACE15B_03555 [Bryobacteraceae bacterium]